MKVIVIVGPTAIGKTKLGVELAKKLKGEVINADSTQIFKGLDIATAKVTKDEMIVIMHHLINIKTIKEDYTVFDYQKDCRNKIDDLIKKGKTAILVGGTGLYIKASLYDYKFEEEIKMKNDYESYSNDELYDMLLKIDSSTNIHINNRKMIIRSLDYYRNNKKLLSEKEKTNTLVYDAIFIGLTTSRDVLYDRINKRVDKMINDGLLKEAKKLYDNNIRTKAVMTPIGYKELFMYFDNKISYEDAIEMIKKRSRNYAKRQYTWFNNQFDTKWVDVDLNNFDNTGDDVLKLLEDI